MFTKFLITVEREDDSHPHSLIEVDSNSASNWGQVLKEAAEEDRITAYPLEDDSNYISLTKEQIQHLYDLDAQIRVTTHVDWIMNVRVLEKVLKKLHLATPDRPLILWGPTPMDFHCGFDLTDLPDMEDGVIGRVTTGEEALEVLYAYGILVKNHELIYSAAAKED